jgi:transketolase
MNNCDTNYLNRKSNDIRRLTVDSIGKLGVGHIGGSLSIVEALVVLYYQEMNIDPKQPDLAGRDRFVLSKGHAGPALYAVLADKGYFDVCLLDTLNQPETILPSHCDMLRTPGIDMTAGSLGQGFSCAAGMAMASKIRQDNATIFTIIGDGESQEGQIWEAAMFAAQKKLNNLIAFTDYNKLQIDGSIAEVMDLAPLDAKWEAFGWNTIVVRDGHDVTEITAAVRAAKQCQDKPSMIILNTVKGKGVRFVEAAGAANHNMTMSAEQRLAALQELERGAE